jgi:Cdc6-like AAA superfamily ATPase
MATNKRKRAIRALAAERGISYTAAMREHDEQRSFVNEVNRSRRMVFDIGNQEEATDPFTIDFAQSPHALVVGATGTGKTNLALHLIAQALERAESFSPGEIAPVHVFDHMGFAARWGGGERVRVSGPDDDTTDHAYAITVEMERRYQTLDAGTDEDTPPLLIILDSFKPSGDQQRFWEHVRQWLRKGRSAGLIVVIMQHRPVYSQGVLATPLGAETMSDMFNRIAFGPLPREVAMLTFGERGRGDMRARLPLGQARVLRGSDDAPVVVTVPPAQQD